MITTLEKYSDVIISVIVMTLNDLGLVKIKNDQCILTYSLVASAIACLIYDISMYYI